MGELLRRIDSREMSEWMAFFQIRVGTLPPPSREAIDVLTKDFFDRLP